jgi:hypothetical protein
MALASVSLASWIAKATIDAYQHLAGCARKGICPLSRTFDRAMALVHLPVIAAMINGVRGWQQLNCKNAN